MERCVHTLYITAFYNKLGNAVAFLGQRQHAQRPCTQPCLLAPQALQHLLSLGCEWKHRAASKKKPIQVLYMYA